MTYQVPFHLCTDFYKPGHILDYPSGITDIQENMTGRKGRDGWDDGYISFGIQAAVQHYLIDYANETFFNQQVNVVAAEFSDAMMAGLGPNGIGEQHWRDLHDLGYLPIEIRAIEEGRLVPYGVPVVTFRPTDVRFVWLIGYIETLFSASTWQMMTSATTAFRYRVLLEDWAKITGVASEFIDFQAHDFSFRGMSSLESALHSGAGHLTAFKGTDTIPAIAYVKHYYGCEGMVGGSVAATEHSVMCAGGKDDERETFLRLMRTHPTGILSVVSDTWDLWKVLTEILPSLKDEILARDGKLVIRPDSGDPVKIICGDPDAPEGTPARKGVYELLYDVFGGEKNEQGFIVLDNRVGAIYGDSINLDRCNRIQQGLFDKGFAPWVVFGIGSFTYQYVTRDTHGFAIKATWAIVDGEEHALFKDPVTDDGTKKSARGMVAVAEDENGTLSLVDDLCLDEWDHAGDWDKLKIVFHNGVAYGQISLDEVRANVRREVAKYRAR